MPCLTGLSLASEQLDNSLQKEYEDTKRFKIYQVLTFILTFITYALYHANRKVIGIVKTVWNQNCTEAFPDEAADHNDTEWCNWAPFDGDNAGSLLGWMDASFLFLYAFSMFASGYVAERSNLRIYLWIGMFFTGFCNFAIGAAYWLNIHSFFYFIMFNSLAGIAQSTGWPAVVTVMGNWYGKSKRGFIMGTWNIHTSIGNIMGSAIAGAFVSSNWGWSFGVPAVIAMAFSFVMLMLTVPQPSQVNLENPNKFTDYEEEDRADSVSEHTSLLRHEVDVDSESEEGSVHKRVTASHTSESVENLVDEEDAKPISLFRAMFIPGVLTYAIALFFIKLVNYVFMYWLPKYINSSTDFTPQQSANISVFFDLGGILGGMTAGAISDRFKKPANTCFWSILCSLPMLFIYFKFGSASMGVSAALLVPVGFFVNAPYALITTAVSAALGTHETLQGNAKALATVTALIDGTGSLGAAIGPLLTGIFEDKYGWISVFIMLYGAAIISMLCLLRLVINELKGSCSSSSQTQSAVNA